MPHQKLIGFKLTINGTQLDIPNAAWNDVYDPTLSTCSVCFNAWTGFMYIYIPDSSDGAGAYMIAWAIKNGKFIRRYVDGF